VDADAFRVVVLTVSDSRFRGEAEDTAGPAVAELLERELGARVCGLKVLPDEADVIADRLRHYCDEYSIDMIVTVGGTGFAPTDVTPEATRAVIERLAPGLDEAMRSASLASVPTAMLSRGVSGIRGQTLIVNLPGSERGAVQNLSAILSALEHGLRKLRGDATECGGPAPGTRADTPCTNAHNAHNAH
jgi:molybdenum cofactor synthesis domain-containing protein